MIIIEGAPYIGLSDFAKDLWTLPVLAEMGYTLSENIIRTGKYDLLSNYVDLIAPLTVQKRMHLSELVRQTLNKDRHGLSPEMYRLIDSRFRQVAAFTVILTADPEIILSNVGPPHHYSPEESVEMNTIFLQIVSGAPPDGYNPDWDYHIHLTRRTPNPETADIDAIVQAYTKRTYTVGEYL